MLFTSIRELKAKTSEVLRKVEKNDEPAIVTLHGKPKAVIIPADEDELEDLLYQYSPRIRKLIEEGLEDAKSGPSTPWEEVVKNHVSRKNDFLGNFYGES